MADTTLDAAFNKSYLSPDYQKLATDMYNSTVQPMEQDFTQKTLPQLTENLAARGIQFGGQGTNSYARTLDDFNRTKGNVASTIATNLGQTALDQAFRTNEAATQRAFEKTQQESQNTFNAGESALQRAANSSENALNRALTSSEGAANRTLDQLRISEQGKQYLQSTFLPLVQSGAISPEIYAQLTGQKLDSGFKTNNQLDLNTAITAQGLDPNNPDDVASYKSYLKTLPDETLRQTIISGLLAGGNMNPSSADIVRLMNTIKNPEKAVTVENQNTEISGLKTKLSELQTKLDQLLNPMDTSG